MIYGRNHVTKRRILSLDRDFVMESGKHCCFLNFPQCNILPKGLSIDQLDIRASTTSPFLAFIINPFAPGDFAEKRVLKLVEWFSGHCRAIKS